MAWALEEPVSLTPLPRLTSWLGPALAHQTQLSVEEARGFLSRIRLTERAGAGEDGQMAFLAVEASLRAHVGIPGDGGGPTKPIEKN